MSDDSRKLLGRLKTIYGPSYLTLMSLVQSGAVGYFAYRMKDWAGFGSADWVLAVTTMIVIVLVWNEYVMGVATFNWIPTLADSAIPFMLCGTEVGLAASLGPAGRRWWFFVFFLLGVVTVVAYANMYLRARKEPENRALLERLKKHRHAWFALTGACVPVGLLFWRLDYPRYDVLLAGLVLLMVVAFAVRTALYWRAVQALARAGEVDREAEMPSE